LAGGVTRPPNRTLVRPSVSHYFRRGEKETITAKRSVTTWEDKKNRGLKGEKTKIKNPHRPAWVGQSKGKRGGGKRNRP